MLEADWRGLSVLYLCPIKALLNNLEPRLSYYAGLVGRRVGVWHGDIADSVKERYRRDPPDILLTTPESLEGMLISTRTERDAFFRGIRLVIIDELHAFAGDDRGWHLRSVLQRLGRYAESPIQRIGLSATVQNPKELLDWLAPEGDKRVVGSSSVGTDADVTVDHVGSLENAATVISRLHRGEKRLVFCDSRAASEKLGHTLNAAGVRTFVSHASLSVAERRAAEQAFSEERDCVIVATSTLELGIDVGDLDRVIQIDAPKTVSSFLQRMGRAGRRPGTVRNCLFLATGAPGFLQALGITRLWSQGWVEPVKPAPLPWNVVAQQTLLMTLEWVLITRRDLLNALVACFPELDANGLSICVQTLLERRYLAEQEAGVLQIGLEAERVFGRSHYRDLLATFSGSDLLLGRHGVNEIGYIDPASLVGEDAEYRVLLAGRSWRVTAIDWKRRVAALEPSEQRGQARWIGSSGNLDWEIAQSIRMAIREGMPDIVKLSRRAMQTLEELQDEIPTASNPFPQEALANGRHRVWTFSGTRTNRQYLANFRSQGARQCNALYLDFAARPPENMGPCALPPPSPSSPEVASLLDGLKFSDLIDEAQAADEVIARVFKNPPITASATGSTCG
jgi:ATP-dependent Lhr-like helicase